MEKVKKHGLYVAAIVAIAVVYINVGVLVMYSIDGNVEQTTATNLVRRLIDWWDLLVNSQGTAWDSSMILLWPIFVGLILFMNIGYTLFWAGTIIWTAAKWLFIGGFWRWLGVIKG